MDSRDFLVDLGSRNEGSAGQMMICSQSKSFQISFVEMRDRNTDQRKIGR